MPDNRNRLLENILKRIGLVIQRNTVSVDDDESSDIVTRKETGEHSLTTSQGAYDWYYDQLSLPQTRAAKYRDYEQMDTEDPELSSALDMYADNAVGGDSDVDNIIKIVADDPKAQAVIEEGIRTLNLNEEIWSIARSLAKYGDVFEEVVVHSNMEVARLKHLDPATIRIRKDKWGRYDSEYPYEQISSTGEVIAKFRDWQILHFRLRRDRGTDYGVDGAVFYPIRKVYKQLSMIEDGMVIARLTRAPQRYAYIVDTTGIEPGKPTLDYLREVKEMMKKQRTIDPRTGKMNLQYNPLSMEEDLFIAAREGSRADVKVLQGSSNLGVITDVEYFQNKKFAGIKIPKAYLGIERDVNAKATLTQQDVQFARSVRRLQVALIAGLRKLFDFMLMIRGFVPSQVNYEVILPITSTIDEMRRWQVELMKTKIATTLRKDLGVSLHWILVNLLDFSEADVEEIIKSLEDEDSLDNVLMAKATANTKAPEPEPANTGNADGDGEGAGDGTGIGDDAGIGADVGIGDDAGTAEESKVSIRELRILRLKLKEEIDTLRDLIDMELQRKRGRGIKPQSEVDA